MVTPANRAIIPVTTPSGSAVVVTTQSNSAVTTPANRANIPVTTPSGLPEDIEVLEHGMYSRMETVTTSPHDSTDISLLSRESCSRRNFSVNLVRKLYDEETRRRSNVSGRMGKQIQS